MTNRHQPRPDDPTYDRAPLLDRYDASYRRGYNDGLAQRPSSPPEDDSEVNYRDGYEDGTFKREQEERP
jgi:hypothetical protein